MKQRIFYFIMLVLSISTPLSVIADEFVVSNREPSSGEVNYFPSEGDSCSVNPPGFVWLPEEGAVSYVLQCSSQADFSSVEYQAENITHNVHCPAITFTAGTWYWRYAFVTAENTQSGWSQTRSFSIAADAVKFPLPSIPQLLKRLPETHPKLFIRPENVEEKYALLSLHYTSEWKQFLDYVKEQMNVPLVSEEPPAYPSGGTLRTREKADIDVWRANRRIVVDAVERAANLAFMYLMTKEERYGLRAKEWVMAVMQWDPHGTTGYRMNDECAMPIMSRISRAYTWAYPLFSDEEKLVVSSNMAARARDCYDHLIRTRHTSRPYGSHNNRAWHFLGEVAIVFIDEIPEAKTWLKYAMDVFYTVYPVWNDEDGGWHEGAAYWRTYIDRVTWWMDSMDSAFGINAYQLPYFQNAGDFPLYVNPLKSQFAGFGDMADTHSWKKNQSLMKHLANKTDNPYWNFYAGYKVTPDPQKQITYLDLLRLDGNHTPKSSFGALHTSKLFRGTGIASMHSFIDNLEFDTHLLFKSSPFGSQSHGFNAQNSFILTRDGLPVLHWSGHRDWHGSPHHQNWMWETHSDNTITVNGFGQKKHSADSKGKIVAHDFGKLVDYIAGDAAEAYDGKLDTFVRHILFIKPDIILMVDELEAPAPSSFQFHLHASEEFAIDDQYTIRAMNQDSGVRIAFVTPVVEVTQTSKTEPPPVNWDKQQWHLTANTTERKTQQYFVTAMKAFSGEEYAKMQIQYFPVEEVDMYGIRINNDKLIVLVINESRETFTVNDTVSDAHIMVLYTNSVLNELITYVTDATFLTISDETVLQSEERTQHLVPTEKMIEIMEQYQDDTDN